MKKLLMVSVLNYIEHNNFCPLPEAVLTYLLIVCLASFKLRVDSLISVVSCSQSPVMAFYRDVEGLSTVRYIDSSLWLRLIA